MTKTLKFLSCLWKGVFETSPSKISEWDIKLLQLEREKQMLPYKQQIEDNFWKNEIESKAKQMFHEYQMEEFKFDLNNVGKKRPFDGYKFYPILLVPLPSKSVYTVYDITTAKNLNYHAKVLERFRELKEEFNN